jgi:hypothetical protein
MSGSPPPAENPSGQEQDRPDQRENSLDADSHQPKRQREEPDEWKKHQDQKRERPRHNQEQAPNEKGDERFHDRRISSGGQTSTAVLLDTGTRTTVFDIEKGAPL